MDNKVEILAPAGTFESLKAAVSAGADAVYAGADRFSARAYAGNFDREELLEAVDYVHMFGRKLHLTLNILMKESEISDDLIEWLTPVYERGLDAVIVQDLGLCSLLHEHFPDLAVHASTQMSITSPGAAKMLASLGVSRVIPARELSLEEMRSIRQNGDTEVECFVHGAMCYAYSGRCLFSSFLGERSGNRGRCAQPCRLAYRAPGDKTERYWLSMQDLSVIESVPELIEAGISSFKIEGRMKSPEYVSAVTSVYRKYVDLYYLLKEEGRPEQYCVSEEDRRLIRAYSREKTGPGYYHQRNGRSMITVTNPSYRSGGGLGGSDSGSFAAAAIREARIPVRASAVFRKGEKALFRLSSSGACAEAVSDMEIQEAQRAPMDEGKIRRQLEKTDRYPYDLIWDHLEVEPDIFIPVGAVNKMRRSAFSELKEALCMPYRRKTGSERLRRPQNAFSGMTREHDRRRNGGLHVLVSDMDQLTAVLAESGVSRVIVESSLLPGAGQIREMGERIHSCSGGREFFLALPHVYRPDSGSSLIPPVFSDECIKALGGCDGILARNLDTAAELRSRGYCGYISADYMLYAFNSQGAAALARMGFDGYCYPVELHRRDIADTEKAALSPEMDREILVYGFVPRMISAQCLQKNTGKCTRIPGFLTMSDRRGETFAVQNRCDSCYNIIYNSVPLSLHSRLDRLAELPGCVHRLDFTVESASQVRDVLALFTGETDKVPFDRFTKGHFDKGVL